MNYINNDINKNDIRMILIRRDGGRVLLVNML